MFIVAVWLFLTFCFSFLLFNLFFLRKTLCSTWKKLQVQIMVFNKKAVVKISTISNSKNSPWSFSLENEFFLENVSRIVCLIFLVLIVN